MTTRITKRKPKKRSKWMSLSELLEHVMETQGMTEEEAKAEILRALQAGELTAYGRPVLKQ